MAIAKKTTKSGPSRVSKRKKTSGRKTTRSKTKITKVNRPVTSDRPETRRDVAEQPLVMTNRRQRLVEKARAREAMPQEQERPDEIKAVKITDVSGVVYDKADYDAMVAMYDATIQDIKEGEIVQGRIIGVNPDDVIVDVGFKSEGIIPMNEFTGEPTVAVGDDIEVFLETFEDTNGQLLLSKQKADFMRVWDRIRDVHDAGDTVEGKIARRIKGGVVVDIMGVDAFLPGSQVSLRQVPDFDALIGDTIEVKIIKLNKSRRNIVVSRRVVLEEERERMRSTLLNEIEVGQIRQGVVKNITDFGVFIDLGGVDGLLHITDMSWGRIRHPSEMVQLGEKIDVKILDYDDQTSRISLGLKQMTPYPWENIEQKFPIGKKIKGTVVSITDYGAFVELEKGIEGLIHISEMSWTQHIKHPSKIMSVGDQVDAVVLSVDKENEKISLGIKQMEPDPWTTIEEKYPAGKTVGGRVRNLTAFGAFVELEEGIDGLVHISDMSWTRRIQHPSEVMKKGDKVDIKVLKVDHENRRISLGFKQLTEDPWPELAKKYSLGSECLGTVAKVLDRGVVVDLGDGVEGFVPTKELSEKEVDDPSKAFNEGESIPLQVIEFDRGQHKVTLSVVAYYKKREKEEIDEFMAKQKKQVAEAPASPPTPRPAPRPAPEPERPARKPQAPMTTAMADAMPAELLAQLAAAQKESTEDSSEVKAKDEAAEDKTVEAKAESSDTPAEESAGTVDAEEKASDESASDDSASEEPASDDEETKTE